MRLPKLTRKKKTARNLMVILLLLGLLWGAGGFRSLTLDGAVRREAARYFAEPGEDVVTFRKGGSAFEKWIFDQDKTQNALVITHRGGNIHAYMCRGWPLRSADYMGVYPIEGGKCVIKIPHGGTAVGFMDWPAVVDGEEVTIRIEERRREV